MITSSRDTGVPCFATPADEVASEILPCVARMRHAASLCSSVHVHHQLQQRQQQHKRAGCPPYRLFTPKAQSAEEARAQPWLRGEQRLARSQDFIAHLEEGTRTC